MFLLIVLFTHLAHRASRDPGRHPAPPPAAPRGGGAAAPPNSIDMIFRADRRTYGAVAVV